LGVEIKEATMKVYVHHDETGTIHSLVFVDAPASAGAMLAPRPGEFVTEVEGLKDKLGAGEPDVEALREIAKRHKVSTAVPRSKLAKKKS
jgi:hypothetical protein